MKSKSGKLGSLMSPEKNKTAELFSLKDKVVVITGGAGFLAKTYAETLFDADATVILADINGEEARKVAAELSNEEKKIEGLQVDVTKKTSVEKLVEQVVSKHNQIDILINNAAINPKVEKTGLSDSPPFEDFPVEVWQKDLNVDLTGMFLTSQAVVRQMIKQKHGVIINISSMYGLVSPNQNLYKPDDEKQTQFKPASYAASKAAVINLTRYLATYLAKYGIRVNCLAPGGIFQDQPEEFLKKYAKYVPMGRMGKAEELAGPVLFLASNASSYMTGTTLVIDGGWTAW